MLRNFYTLALYTFFWGFTASGLLAQTPGTTSGRSCQNDGVISLAFSGATELSTCADDDMMDRIRFQVRPFRQAFAYFVVDESDVIQYLGFSNFINFDLLPVGTLRVYAFSNYGRLAASVGDVFDENLVLSRPCAGLTTNFVTVSNGMSGDVVIASEQDRYDVCPEDGSPDVIEFTSTGLSVTYLITTSTGELLATNTTGSIDFEGAGEGICNVYAFASPAPLPIATGDNISALSDVTGCGIGLSTNFITVDRQSTDGGTVTLTDGSIATQTCPGDGADDLIEFNISGTVGNDSRLVVTDADNVIIGLPAGLTVNFEDAGAGVCRVWSVSYSGNFTAELNATLQSTRFSDGCSDLSDNFVTVTRTAADGGTISTAAGETDLTVCLGDGADDTIDFAVSGFQGENNRLVVTDANNLIIGLPDGFSVDFEDAGPGVCRVWSVAVGDDFSAANGDLLEDAVLSSECSAISAGFVTVTRGSVNGGTILTEAGVSSARTCPGDGNDDLITFVVTAAGGNNSRIIITDDNNVIIGLPDGLAANFEDAGVGTCRAWHLDFTGNFTAALGDIITETDLADGCSDLSNDFVSVIRDVPTGGTILTTDGASMLQTCPGDGLADVIEVVTTGSSGGDVLYVVTDGDNNILNFSESNSFNLEGAGLGNCRIWSLTYSGNPSVTPGEDIRSATLADGCFELSADFVEVFRIVPEGGTVSTDFGATEVSICPGDGFDDILNFVSDDATGENFIFSITDTNNVILGVTDGNMVNFDDFDFGVCRIWGLSYSGEIIASIGDTAFVDTLTTGCFGLSSNFVTVRKELPSAGVIGLRSGQNEVSVCAGDGVPDVLRFVTNGVRGDNFAYIITDVEGNILGFPPTARIDFDDVGPGICRVYSFVYVGDILAGVGDNIDSELASGCFHLSENFIQVNRDGATTGPISTENGQTEIMVCPGDAQPDFVRFDSTGTTLQNFNYLITDTNGIVIRVAFTDRIDFENLPVGTCRVYGLGYSGIVSASPGDMIEMDQLATQCFKLSDNFVTINKQLPEGGSIATSTGDVEVTLCSGDGVPDIVTVEVTGNSGENYAFILSTEQDIVLATSTDNEFDFDSFDFGSCRIRGVSYQGELEVEIGDNAGLDRLSSGCFDLSDNFIVVTRAGVSGGSISIDGGETEAFTCPGDGTADVLSFVNDLSATTDYQYVVTDEDNIILALVDGERFDFEPAGTGVCRVWGFAFAGEITAVVGENAATANLASGCFELSDNFITVVRAEPDGGSVSLEDGRFEEDVCSGVDSEPVLNFITTSTSAGYTYLIVQDSLLLTAISDTFNFNMADAGVYQVFGLAYTGSLTLTPVTNIFTDQLATSCFDLSETFVNVNVTEVDGGSILGNGAEEVFLCPETMEMDAGIVALTTSSSRADENYRYVITTTTRVILSVVPDGATDFDFGSLPLMELKVFGISYTGEFLAGPGFSLDGTPLATGCVDISDNCLLVLNDTPQGGVISFDNVPANNISCTVDGNGSVSISSTSDSFTGYAGVVTDTNNVILLVSADANEIDLGSLPQDAVYRVWGLAYTGNLTARVGDVISDVALADNCFELSENSLEVTQGGSISAGTIINDTTEGTGDTITWCLPDDTPIAVINASVNSPNYRYIITEEDGTVRATNLPGNIIPFTTFEPGTYRIYGFNFTGMSLIGINQNINTTLLSTECAALTSNFLTINLVDPDGGMLTAADGSTEVEVVINGTGGAATAFVDFTNDSDSSYNYTYLITDDNNMVLALSNENRFNFGPAGVGVCRVWGVAYTGNLTASPNDVITEAILADGCFELSANFVQVTRVEEIQTGGVIDTENTAVETNIDITERTEINLIARPNPTSGQTLYLDISTTFSTIPSGELSVRDINGIAYTVRTLAGGGDEATVPLDISMLPPGMYFVQLATDAGLQSVRFMKQ